LEITEEGRKKKQKPEATLSFKGSWEVPSGELEALRSWNKIPLHLHAKVQKRGAKKRNTKPNLFRNH